MQLEASGLYLLMGQQPVTFKKKNIIKKLFTKFTINIESMRLLELFGIKYTTNLTMNQIDMFNK